MSAVDEVLEVGGEAMPGLMDRIERRMGEVSEGHGPLLAQLAGDTIAAGGKRLRPLLVCLAAGVPPPDNDQLISSAAAVELVHAATLVHDDVIDGSALRRGRPTVVASAGRALATATGDLLFSRAFAELVRTGSLEAVRILSRASSELAAGELMQRADAWGSEVTVERYLTRCRLKTAVLFRAACELGALAGDGLISSLANFGEQIGLAFQILDDILDVIGPAERTGKPRGTDLLDGTVTLPLILSRESDPALRALDLRAVEDPDAAAAVCDRIEETPALGLARERALRLVRAAKDELPDLPARQRSALELVADRVVDRYS